MWCLWMGFTARKTVYSRDYSETVHSFLLIVNGPRSKTKLRTTNLHNHLEKLVSYWEECYFIIIHDFWLKLCLFKKFDSKILWVVTTQNYNPSLHINYLW